MQKRQTIKEMFNNIMSELSLLAVMTWTIKTGTTIMGR